MSGNAFEAGAPVLTMSRGGHRFVIPSSSTIDKALRLFDGEVFGQVSSGIRSTTGWLCAFNKPVVQSYHSHSGPGRLSARFMQGNLAIAGILGPAGLFQFLHYFAAPME
jgi:hypothetical protein